MTALISAEWIKVRSVRSTFWSAVLTVGLSVGLAYMVGLSFRSNFAHLPPDERAGWDPLFATFSSLTIGNTSRANQQATNHLVDQSAGLASPPYRLTTTRGAVWVSAS
jgi:hypothetical protein